MDARETIAVVSASTPWRRWVRAYLRRHGFFVDSLDSLCELDSSQQSLTAIVIHVPDLDRTGGEIPVEGPPTILVTSSDPQSLRHLHRVRADAVLLVGEEERLPTVLDSVRRCALLVETSKAILGSSGIPPLTRSTVRVLFDSQNRYHSAESKDITKTIGKLADQIGISADHLRRVMNSYGVSLRFMIDASLALRAYSLRTNRHLSWERVAWQLDYASSSGLCGLFQRTFDKPPSEITAADVASLQSRVLEHLKSA